MKARVKLCDAWFTVSHLHAAPSGYIITRSDLSTDLAPWRDALDSSRINIPPQIPTRKVYNSADLTPDGGPSESASKSMGAGRPTLVRSLCCRVASACARRPVAARGRFVEPTGSFSQAYPAAVPLAYCWGRQQVISSMEEEIERRLCDIGPRISAYLHRYWSLLVFFSNLNRLSPDAMSPLRAVLIDVLFYSASCAYGCELRWPDEIACMLFSSRIHASFSFFCFFLFPLSLLSLSFSFISSLLFISLHLSVFPFSFFLFFYDYYFEHQMISSSQISNIIF